jgi:hypothetical protein
MKHQIYTDTYQGHTFTVSLTPGNPTDDDEDSVTLKIDGRIVEERSCDSNEAQYAYNDMQDTLRAVLTALRGSK